MKIVLKNGGSVVCNLVIIDGDKGWLVNLGV